MWVRASGPISESTLQLTLVASSHLIVAGEFAALIDTGVAPDAARLVEGVRSALESGLPFEFVLLTHASFKTVGGLPALRTHYPQIRVLASPATQEMLSGDEFLRGCYDLNVAAAEAMKEQVSESFDVWREAVKIDQIVRDGDSVMLGGGVEIKVIAAPGYSSDSHCYFVRPDSILAAGQAAGNYAGRDKHFFVFHHSVEDYLSSLDKLATLELKALILPHSGALTGELSHLSLKKMREDVVRFVDNVRLRLAQGELVDDIYASLYSDWLEQGATPDGPFADRTRDGLKRMIELIAAQT